MFDLHSRHPRLVAVPEQQLDHPITFPHHNIHHSGEELSREDYTCILPTRKDDPNADRQGYKANRNSCPQISSLVFPTTILPRCLSTFGVVQPAGCLQIWLFGTFGHHRAV